MTIGMGAVDGFIEVPEASFMSEIAASLISAIPAPEEECPVSCAAACVDARENNANIVMIWSRRRTRSPSSIADAPVQPAATRRPASHEGRHARLARRLVLQYGSYNGSFMPCFMLLFGLAFPRFAIVMLFLFTGFLQRAYHSLLLVALGFLFLPLTTIVYAWIVNGRHPLDGVYLAALILSVLADLGLIGHGEYQRRRA